MSVYIIAEAGVNHNGDLNLAKQLVDVAKAAGVDAVKFQTFVAEKAVSKFAEKANYQKINTDSAQESQLEMIKKLELGYSAFLELEQYCRELEIQFLSTPFDLESIGFLNQIEMPFWKLPSGEITNYPYLKALGRTKKPVVMSTGMATMEEIRNAMDVLTDFGCPEIKLLHCNTQYPTPMEDVNLKAMNTMKEKFGCIVGYSDHTQGIEVPIAAVALGAQIIEKHFTLDKTMAGPDHKASLNPVELESMVKAIRNIEVALGNGVKQPTMSERGNISIARKSIVANQNIHKGDLLSEKNISTKRPGNGISPMRWDKVIGTIAIKDFKEDELIEI